MSTREAGITLPYFEDSSVEDVDHQSMISPRIIFGRHNINIKMKIR